MEVVVREKFVIELDKHVFELDKTEAKELYDYLGKALSVEKEIVYISGIPWVPYRYPDYDHIKWNLNHHYDYPKFEWLHSSNSHTFDPTPGGACVEK